MAFGLISGLMAMLAIRFSDQYQPGMINDDAYYYLGAVSLAHNGQYLDLVDPLHAPQRHYTPGYPLFLSAVFKIFPENVSTARWASGLLTVVALGCLLLLGEQLLGFFWGLVACSWMLLLPATSIWATALLSEIPYLALSLVLIRLMIKPRAPPLWLLAILLSYLFLIRPIGLTLVLAYGAWAAFKKDPKTAAAMGGLGLVLFGFHFFWANAGTGASSYHKEFLDQAKNVASWTGFVRVLFEKGRYYTAELTGTFVPWNALASWGSLGYGCGILLALLPLAGMLGGCLQPLGGPWGLLYFYSLLYLAVHIGAYHSVSGRYIFPLLPILYCVIASGWKRFCESRWMGAPYLGLWIVVSLAANLWGLYSLGRSSAKSLPLRPPTATFAWIKSAAPPQAIIAADVCAPVTLYTGLSCASFPYAANPDTLLYKLLVDGVGYVLLRESQDIQKTVGLDGNALVFAQRTSAIRSLRASPAVSKVYASPEEGTEVLRLPDRAGSYRRAYELVKQGEAAMKSGSGEKSRKLFLQALSIDARLCDVRIYMAALELSMGHAQNAMPLLKEAVRLCPAYPLARLNYAKSLGAAGRLPQAREELTAALELSRETAGLESDRTIHRQAGALLRLIASSPPESRR